MFLGKGSFNDLKKKQWLSNKYMKKHTMEMNAGSEGNIDPSIAKKMKVDMKNCLNNQNSLSNFIGDSSAQELNLGTRSGQKFFPSKKITIWAWNVNGVRALIKKRKLDEFFKVHNPEILCLSETKIDEDALKVERLERHVPKEYLQYWN